MHQMVPTIYYFFWVRYHPSRIYSQKKPWLETKYDPFSTHHQTTLSESLDYGPTSLVLAKYRLMVLRPLYACSTIFYFCLLSILHRFCCSRLVLFGPAACLFYLCLSSMEEGMGSWACPIFFCLLFDFFFFLIRAFSTTDFVLFLHASLAMFVISFGLAFLSFTQFLPLTLFVIPCFFILVFTAIL